MTRRSEDLKALNERLLDEILRRERAQAELSRVSRAWTETLDAIDDLISVHDAELRILRTNRAMGRRFGCEPGELVGRRCHELFHGTDEPWPECPHRKALETGVTVTCEIIDPGFGTPLQVSCSPYRNGSGEVVGSVHVVRDISEQKRREEEREALVAQLQEALAQAKLLSGLLPICASCKSIRDDQGYWNQIETYIRERSDAEFTHGICPECAERLYPRWAKRRQAGGGG
ncbi:MAG: PAS domain-containing protein [Deferrisomatales bacterium]|nr:PAS domain-containing protein [Deferrisomatales bacterium]